MREGALVYVAFMVCALGLGAEQVTLPGGTVAEVYPGATIEKGVVVSASLMAPVVISTPLGKVRLERWVWYHPDGRFKAGYVAEPLTLDTPAGKLRVGPSASGSESGYVSFHPSGRIETCSLMDPLFLPTSAGKLLVDCVRFREDGGIQTVWLVDTQTVRTSIGDLPVYWCIDFTPGGGIERCYVHGPVEARTPAGKLILRGNRDHAQGYTGFYENGALAQVFLGTFLVEAQIVETPIGALELTEPLRFHENGAIRSCHARRAYTVTVGSQKVRMGSDDLAISYYSSLVCFFPSGAFKAGHVIDPQTIKGKLTEKALIAFSEAGEFLGQGDPKTVEPEERQ